MTDQRAPTTSNSIAFLNHPESSLYKAFADPDQFARWYGPAGFPVPRETIDIDARVGGRQRFTMVGEADPSMRTAFDGNFTEVVANQLLASTGTWHGIPGQESGMAIKPARRIRGL